MDQFSVRPVFLIFSFRTPNFTYLFFAPKAETASMSALDRVEEVLIDEGVFKYVYIRVYQDAGKDDR
jgi:hypothetical protein